MDIIPGKPLELFVYDHSLCFLYEENGHKKAARFEPPDRFHPIEPWIYNWGSIAGIIYLGRPSEAIFELNVEIDAAELPRSFER